MKVNPNNESYYLPDGEGGFTQFENARQMTVEDGKLILERSKNSFYRDFDQLPPFARSNILDEARRQVKSASLSRLQVEWLVSDGKAVEALKTLFASERVPVKVTEFPK